MANGNGTTPADESGTKDEAAVTVVNTLSIMVVGAYIVMMPLWMFWPPQAPAEILAIINQMTGAWQMAFATVIAYHLGSTKGQKDSASANRETIKSLANTAASTAATASTVANTAAVVAAAPAGGAPAAPTTVTTTTETKVAGAAEPKPAPGPVLDVAAEPTSPEIEAAIASLEAAAKDGIRSLDTAWATLSPMMQARTEFGYRALREAKVAELQGSNTPPKS